MKTTTAQYVHPIYIIRSLLIAFMVHHLQSGLTAGLSCRSHIYSLDWPLVSPAGSMPRPDGVLFYDGAQWNLLLLWSVWLCQVSRLQWFNRNAPWGERTLSIYTWLWTNNECDIGINSDIIPSLVEFKPTLFKPPYASYFRIFFCDIPKIALINNMDSS